MNDDDDSGEVDNDDVPQQGNDADANSGLSGRVNGMRDLVDFFPLYFDLEDFLSGFDDLTKVKFKLSGQGMRYLQYEDNYAGFAPDEAGKFLRDIDTARDLADDDTWAVSTDPNNPRELWHGFVELTSQGKGVLLMEAYPLPQGTSAELKLHVFVDNTELFTYDFHVETSTVEDMFEHRNITGSTTEYDGSVITPSIAAEADRTTAPNWPNDRTNGKNFVFLHGYKVNGQQARGWQAEVFKRMHQMVSNARFVGVTWHGATGLDYHKGVFQAFQSGDALGGALSDLSGDVAVAAHSLGNMVVSHAIQQGGFAPDRYYMLNSAVAIEAYVSLAAEQDMVEEDGDDEWIANQQRLFAANWYDLFDSSDNRNKLRWSERFIDVAEDTALHNFYSSTEDVLDKNETVKDASVLAQLLSGNFNFSRGAWKAQELVKGKSALQSVASLGLERTQSGWAEDSDFSGTPLANITNEQLKTVPYFEEFLEADLTSADVNTAHTKAGESKVHYDILARAIPSLSYAAAVDAVPAPPGVSIQNFDMHANGRTDSNEWPTEGHTADAESNGAWLHSDFRNVALPYVVPMYEEMINRGTLNAN